MIPINIPWRLVGAGAALLALAGGVWWYGHGRYEAGYEAAEAVWQDSVREAGERFAEALADQQRLLERSDAALAEARRQGQINRRDLDDALSSPDGRDWGSVALPDSVRLALEAARHPPVPGDP